MVAHVFKIAPEINLIETTLQGSKWKTFKPTGYNWLKWKKIP